MKCELNISKTLGGTRHMANNKHTYPLSFACTSAPCCSKSCTILTRLYPAARWRGVDYRGEKREIIIRIRQGNLRRHFLPNKTPPTGQEQEVDAHDHTYSTLAPLLSGSLYMSVCLRGERLMGDLREGGMDSGGWNVYQEVVH